MMRFLKKTVCAAVALSCLATTPASAACWSNDQADAASVRDMETMLMVSSLRCRLTGDNMLEDYNSFVRAARPALTEVNERLRTHFGTGNAALNAYDSWVTSLANQYGAGLNGLNCGDMKSILQAATHEAGSISGLIRLAHTSEAQPKLPGGRCTTSVAAR